MRGLLLASLLAGPAWAGAPHVVRGGETVESIAEGLGDPALADAIRERNGLEPGAQPLPGTVLGLPDLGGDSACRASYVRFAQGPEGGPAGTLVDAQGTRPLVPGEPLYFGTTVCTDPGAYASLRLARDVDGETTGWDEVTLVESSCLELVSSWSSLARRTSRLALSKGALRVGARDDTTGRILVETAAGVTLGDRGGFRVALEDGATRVEAVDGEVATLAEGVDRAIPEGFGARVEDGAAPSDLFTLPPAGALRQPLDGAVLSTLTFTWEGPEEAFGYFVEVSGSRDFSELYVRQQVDDPPWRTPVLQLPLADPADDAVPVGWWRVVAYDRFGFEGLPSEAHAIRRPGGLGRLRAVEGP